MKIAVLMTRFDSGGVERVVAQLMTGFLEAGHEVDLVTTSSRESVASRIPVGANVVRIGGRFVQVGIPGLLSPRTILGFTTIIPLARYLRKNKPDALLAAQSGATAVLAGVASRKKPWIVWRIANSPQASFEGDPYKAAKLVPLVRRKMFGMVDRVICNSDDVAREIESTNKIPRDRILTIPNPAAIEFIKVRGDEPVNHRWFGSDDRPVAVAAGRLTTQKDYFTLLRAHAKVLEARECNLVILGKGEDQGALEQLARELGISDHIDFVGFVENPWAYMSKATLFVLSSVWEGSPNSLIEALIMATPSVATDCAGGTGEVLAGGKHGHLVPVGDPEGFATAWLDVLNNPDAACARANLGQESTEKYAHGKVIHQYLDALKPLSQ